MHLSRSKGAGGGQPLPFPALKLLFAPPQAWTRWVRVVKQPFQTASSVFSCQRLDALPEKGPDRAHADREGGQDNPCRDRGLQVRPRGPAQGRPPVVEGSSSAIRTLPTAKAEGPRHSMPRTRQKTKTPRLHPLPYLFGHQKHGLPTERGRFYLFH